VNTEYVLLFSYFRKLVYLVCLYLKVFVIDLVKEMLIKLNQSIN